MVMITFSTNELALLKGEKLQTIRWNWPYWHGSYSHYKTYYTPEEGVWEPPYPYPCLENNFKLGLRAQWKRPYAHGSYIMGFAREWECRGLHGHDFNSTIAVRDGYDDVRRLLQALAHLHDKTYKECNEHKFAVIDWEWHYGPFLPGQYQFLHELKALDAYEAYTAEDANWKYKLPVGDWRE